MLRKVVLFRILFICFCMLLFLNLFECNSFGIVPESTELYHGIDVSGWQGKINYDAVEESKIDIVYIKSSEGTRVDPYFYLNYNNSKLNGLKIGVYHYVVSKNVSDARVEAEFFVNLIRDKSIDCKVAMDFESFDGLNKEQINDIAYEFLNTVKSLLGKDVILYSDLSNVENLWDERISNNFGLWLAYYNDYNLIDNLSLPWKTWIGNQYTDEGMISGVRDLVDRDLFTKDIFYDEENVLDYTEVIDENIINYIVKRGDTLTRISRLYNTTVENIAKENNIKNINLIFIGEDLKIIPDYNNLDDEASTSKVYYKVKKGDTLYKISRMYNIPIDKIVRLNNIENPNLIYPNEILRIPS